jgi:hypothetical protein
MAIHFKRSFLEALSNIQLVKHHEFMIHSPEELVDHKKQKSVIDKYGDAKWQVVELINSHFNLKNKFDLYNWLNHNEEDELAYFINEAGSNCLNYSEYKAPHKFHVWLGKKGFIVAIEQKGAGFPAKKIHDHRLKQNEGAAFRFFRNCKSNIFFDDPDEARMVFMEWKFE